ncbi:hypothetical protein C6366_09520 [Desulfonatronum sp. SC1]|nr:hypothetical protein C6366_09520 [Desulfonatronum sp. SC1]
MVSDEKLNATMNRSGATWLTTMGTGDNADTLFKPADQALLRANASGRNRVESSESDGQDAFTAP